MGERAADALGGACDVLVPKVLVEHTICAIDNCLEKLHRVMEGPTYSTEEEIMLAAASAAAAPPETPEPTRHPAEPATPAPCSPGPTLECDSSDEKLTPTELESTPCAANPEPTPEPKSKAASKRKPKTTTRAPKAKAKAKAKARTRSTALNAKPKVMPKRASKKKVNTSLQQEGMLDEKALAKKLHSATWHKGMKPNSATASNRNLFDLLPSCFPSWCADCRYTPWHRRLPSLRVRMLARTQLRKGKGNLTARRLTCNHVKPNCVITLSLEHAP